MLTLALKFYAPVLMADPHIDEFGAAGCMTVVGVVHFSAQLLGDQAPKGKTAPLMTSRTHAAILTAKLHSGGLLKQISLHSRPTFFCPGPGGRP